MTQRMMAVASLLVVVVKGEKPDACLDVGGRGSRKTDGARMMMCVCACATRLRDSW